MKKKKVVSILLMIILAGLILLGLFFSKFTGFISQEQENKVQFYFYDRLTNCHLNGYIFVNNKPLGILSDGYFSLTYDNYIKNFKDNQNFSIFGKLGDCFNENQELFFNKYFKLPEIKKYHFIGEKTLEFSTSINSNNPSNKEYKGFIQPKNVKLELNKINTNSNILDSLSNINQHLNNKINYAKDWDFNKENYWQTPLETIELQQGDCEDYSTLLLSLFLTYNNSLNCYNIIFETHVTTFCHINDYYVYYDQTKTHLKKQIRSNKFEELENLQQEYFEYYKINNTKAYYAFNNKEFYEFKDNQEFINWQASVLNIKSDFNLFNQIEQQIIENTKNLADTDLSGELQTQQVNLLTAKSFPYLIIPLAILILILLIILIKIFKS